MNIFKHYYESETGKILETYSGSNLELQVGPEGSASLMSDDAEGYVLNGVVTQRPELQFSQVGNTLTVPPGTAFFVSGPVNAEGVTEDGVIEFEFAESGTYVITLRMFPYLDAEVILES